MARLPRACCTLLCLMSVSFSTLARLPDHPGLIGLLEIPHQWELDGESNRLLTPLVIYPDTEIVSSEGRSLQSLDELDSFEWSYEAPAAAVYGYHYDGKQSWYQVRLEVTGQSGWVVASKQLQFHPLSELLLHSLAYLTGSWDKQVFSDLADPATARVLDVSGDQIPMEVASTAMFEGQLWILVVVLQQSQCSSSAAPAVLASGWLPVHSAEGEVNAWYYSRGC